MLTATRASILLLLFSFHGVLADFRPHLTNVTVKSSTREISIGYNLETIGRVAVVAVSLFSKEGGAISPSEFSVIGDFNVVMPGPAKSLTIRMRRDMIISKIIISAGWRMQELIEHAVLAVDTTYLKSHLTKIARHRHPRVSIDNLNTMRSFVQKAFAEAKLTVKSQSVDYSKEYTGLNIIGYRKNDNKAAALFIGAHYDVVETSSGADDNATGVAALLEIARLIRNVTFERPMGLVAFDLEEEGTIGSAHFVGHIDDTQFLGYINLDMIGFAITAPYTQPVPDDLEALSPEAHNALELNKFRADFLLNFSNEKSDQLRRKFDSISRVFVPELKVISFSVPNSGTDRPELFRASDHVPFWDRGISAISLGDTGGIRNPNYHSQYDTVDTINMKYFAASVRATLACLLYLAGAKSETEYVLSLIN
jgi:hypothetical protein